MFGFMKKHSERDREERERKKREKEEKDLKRSGKSLTPEELGRLEEAKKAMQKKSLKADDGEVEPESKARSLPPTSSVRMRTAADPASKLAPRQSAPPPTFPKPKKGILKDKSNYGQPVPNQGVRGNVDDTMTLEENTFANEVLSAAAEISAAMGSSVEIDITDSTEKNPSIVVQKVTSQRRTKPVASVKRTSSKLLSSAGQSAVPMAPVIRPPSPIDKCYNDVNLQLPEVAQPCCPQSRELTLHRQAAGDFGFTLRKGVVLERVGNGDDPDERQRTVIFAEPGLKSPLSSGSEGLLPGDRLVEVNGANVENVTREAIIELIRKSGDTVRLLVQPIPELSELSMRSAGPDAGSRVESGGGQFASVNGSMDSRVSGSLQRSGSQKFKTQLAKTEDQLASDKAWILAERVWLVHRGGFAAARVIRAGMPEAEGIENIPDGKCRVKIEHGGEILDVDEDAVEKANPPQFDRVEDLTSLRHLNESCVLHTLRQRYAGNLIHSYAGQSLIVINPMHPLSIYTDKVVQMFRGCRPEDMPPHIFAVAQTTYRNILSSRRDQSIVLTGRSGSGKTTNARHLMNYYVSAVGSVNNVLTVDKLNAAHTLFDTFGGSRTISNTSTSNFTQMTAFDFDHSGQIVSASIQALMLEKSRLVRRPEGEPTFHVFYQMLAGLDSGLRKELQLENLSDPNPLMTPLQRAEDRQRATQMWAKVRHAMGVLKITDDESKAICAVLAAIYHIGIAGVAKGVNNRYQFARPTSAQFAAGVLGTSAEELARVIFTVSGSSQTLSPSYRSDKDSSSGGANEFSGVEALEGFVTGLYTEAFQAIVSMINRSLATNYRSMASINILDSSGFRNPATCGRTTGASFEDFCHNYIQERLQLLFHDTVFTSKQDLYSQENIECDFPPLTSSPAAIVHLIDAQQGTIVQSGAQNSLDMERRGLVWLLDEEALSAGSSDDSFLNLVYQLHGQGDTLLGQGNVPGSFVVNHFQGTNPVTYNVKGWLKACRENHVSRSVGPLLQESKKNEISSLFMVTSRSGVSSNVAGSIVGLVEAGSSLRRVTSMRRTFTSAAAAVKRRSVGVQIKFQMDTVIDMLRRTSVHFVHCILPQHNAGLCDLKNASMAGKPSTQEDVLLNVPLVRSQIRGAEIVNAVRLHRQGFPENMLFADFTNRYEMLIGLSSAAASSNVDSRLAIEQLLISLDLEKSSYRIGLSQVFFRSGILGRLEDMREQKLTGWVIRLQTISRGYLGRKNCQKIKLQHMAVACIQRNVRKLMKIREWPWWRLYTKVKPVLNVHRTEEELKDREYELEQLKQKLEKSERERLEFKLAVDRLETKLSEVLADYQDEHLTSTQAAEMLERETVERHRLEKELKDLQVQFSYLQQQHQKTEMELIDTRMLTASLEDDLDDEDNDEEDSTLRERIDRIRKEAEFSKKKVKQQHEEEIEDYEAVKRQLERKLAEALTTTDEQSRAVAAMKRKAQHLNQEMSDLRLQLEDQTMRNADLEKKQRKFDAELAKVNDGLRNEKQQREKIQRERDELVSLKYTVDQELKNSKLDLESQTEKIRRLDNELRDMTTSERDDKELVKIRQLKNELERKVQDQEEELDEQAGTIQQLEQIKLRLEMGQEKLRQQHVKELEEKEQELENIKSTTQKKIKAIELQLEEEHEDKQKLLRDKRDLERRLQLASEQKPTRDRDVEQALRRDLRRTKALLQDAQLILQKNKDGVGSRTTVKQLRNQLDDAELATAAAVKSRKTMEQDLKDLQQQFESLSKSKQEAEERCMQLSREKNELQSYVEEHDEEMTEIMKKYKAAVQQHNIDLITFQDQSKQIETLQREKESLREESASSQARLDYIQNSSVDREVVVRLEAKIRDLEAKLDLEQTSRHRAESQLNRIKEQADHESDQQQSLRAEEMRSQELIRRLQRQLRELEDEVAEIRRKEADSLQRKLDVEKKFEDLEAEYDQSQADLQLAFKRIADLQAAIEDDLEADNSDADQNSEEDSDYTGDYGDANTDDDDDDDDATEA